MASTDTAVRVDKREIIASIIWGSLLIIPMTLAAFAVGPAMGVPMVLTMLLLFIRSRQA